MPMRWFRVHASLLNNPKFQRITESLRARLLNLWCLAAEQDGLLPGSIAEIAFALRVSEQEAKDTIDRLKSEGLLDETERGLQPHDWNEHQCVSDISTGRVKKHRKLVKRDRTVSETERTRIRNGIETGQSIERVKKEGERSTLIPDSGGSRSATSASSELCDWFCAQYRAEVPHDTWLALGVAVNTPERVAALRANLAGWMSTPKFRDGYGVPDAKRFLQSGVWLKPATDYRRKPPANAEEDDPAWRQADPVEVERLGAIVRALDAKRRTAELAASRSMAPETIQAEKLVKP